MPISETSSRSLPVTRRLGLLAAASLGAASLTTMLGLAGLLFRDAVYPSEELQRAFVANDLVNLLIGVPILLAALALAWRGRLLGLLFWPGALFFVVYNAIAYAVALPPGWPFVLCLLLLALAVYTLIGLAASIDAAAVAARLASRAPNRLAGGVLLSLGVLFLLRGMGVIAGDGDALPRAEAAVLAADFLTIPAWIIGGTAVALTEDGDTLLTGPVADQAALSGLLRIGLTQRRLKQPRIARISRSQTLGQAPFRVNSGHSWLVLDSIA